MEPWFCDVLLGSWKKIFYDFLKCFAHLDVAGVWQILADAVSSWFHVQVKAAIWQLAAGQLKMHRCPWACLSTVLP